MNSRITFNGISSSPIPFLHFVQLIYSLSQGPTIHVTNQNNNPIPFANNTLMNRHMVFSWTISVRWHAACADRL